MASGKQSSDELSSLAARILQLNDFQIKMTVTAAEIRSLAASVLSQDETKGDRIATSKDHLV